MVVTVVGSGRVAARETVGGYHEEQLGVLLDRVRDGFARLDAGEIDVFELDELIHRYKRSARELWKFCGSTGSDWERAAGTLEYLRDHGRLVLQVSRTDVVVEHHGVSDTKLRDRMSGTNRMQQLTTRTHRIGDRDEMLIEFAARDRVQQLALRQLDLSIVWIGPEH